MSVVAAPASCPAPVSFANLVARTEREAIVRADARPRRLRGEFAARSRVLPSGELFLRSQHLDVPGRGEVRWLRMHARKIEIVAIFFYPLPSQSLPIYAMEFVLLGDRPIVAVLDLVHPPEDGLSRLTVQGVMRQAHARFPDLVNATDPPAWFRECRSGRDFFLRPDGAGHEAFARPAAVHFQIWEQLLTMMTVPLRPDTREGSLRRAGYVEAYRSHHRRNTPGLPLLTRSFGSDWTDRFLADSFFGP